MSCRLSPLPAPPAQVRESLVRISLNMENGCKFAVYQTAATAYASQLVRDCQDDYSGGLAVERYVRARLLSLKWAAALQGCALPAAHAHTRPDNASHHRSSDTFTTSLSFLAHTTAMADAQAVQLLWPRASHLYKLSRGPCVGCSQQPALLRDSEWLHRSGWPSSTRREKPTTGGATCTRTFASHRADGRCVR